MFKQIITVGVLAISLPAIAQMKYNPASDTIRIQEIEDILLHKTGNPNKAKVFTNKSNLTIMENPQPISIVTHEIIEQQQAKQLSDIIQNVNGLYITSSRGNSQASFGGRGFIFGNDNLFKNGARVSSGVFPEVSGLERVEVLKGANAMQYGNAAAGGIINMVTKKPRFEQGGSFSMNVGSWDTYKPTIDFYGALSKKAAFRVNGAYEKANSFRDVVQSEKYYFNPSFLFNLGEKSQLIIEGDYLRNNFTPDFGIGTITDKATKIPVINNRLSRSDFPGASWQYQNVQQTSTDVIFNTQLSTDWTLNAVGSYQNYVKDYFSTERMRWEYDSRIPNDRISWERPLGKTYDEQNFASLQLNFNGEVKTGNIKHKILVGTDGDYLQADRYNFDNAKFLGTNGASNGVIYLDDPASRASGQEPIVNKKDRTRTPTQRFGIYAQDFVSLSEKWNVLAGLRWSYIENLEATKNDYKKNTESTSGGSVDRAFSPKVGLVFTPNKNLSVFGTYTNSFSPNSGLDLNDKAIKPSTIDQFEIGVKKNFWNNAVAFNVSAYQIISRDTYQQAEFNLDGTLNNDRNKKEFAGKMRSQGVEVDITGNPTRNLSLIAGYSYNHSVFTDTPDINGYVENQRLVRTPANTANFSAFYTFPDVVKGLKVGATVYYIGNRIAGWNDTKLTLKERNGVTRLVDVKDYTTVDFSVGYEHKKFLIQAKMGNSFDVENYTIHENYSVNPIAPRNFYFTLTYKL